MNLLLVHNEELNNHQVTISGERLKHLRKVLKVKQEDRIKVGIIGEKIGTGIVKEISKEKATLLVHTEFEPPHRLPVHLALAIPRPIMLKRVLSQAASMGVKKISLVKSKRVEKSFLGSSLIENADYKPFLLKGLEQAVDTILPEVSLFKRFKPFIEHIAKENACIKVIAHPGGSARLKDFSELPQKEFIVAIGPEGGWIDYEIERFTEIGFTPFTMGERILRVDTAVPAILSQINMICQL